MAAAASLLPGLGAVAPSPRALPIIEEVAQDDCHGALVHLQVAHGIAYHTHHQPAPVAGAVIP